MDGQTTSYTYDNRNRLLTLLEEDSRQTEFEYDRQGNMVSERSGSGTTTYSYDAFNRTAKVEKPDGSHIRHFYDPEGLRSGLRENGVTSRFVYDGWNMVNELDGDHNIKASYVRGHEWLAQVDGRGDSYYYLNNQHGDVAHITNRLGGIVNSYEYDAFGRTLSATEGIPNRFRYAGEQYDHTTEQYYLRARFYNPVIARFTQEDEYRGDGLICMRMSGTTRLITWTRAGTAASLLDVVVEARRKGLMRGRDKLPIILNGEILKVLPRMVILFQSTVLRKSQISL
nr:RHS repeat-associated core domain-containing protein [Paenibacillus apiarius]